MTDVGEADRSGPLADPTFLALAGRRIAAGRSRVAVLGDPDGDWVKALRQQHPAAVLVAADPEWSASQRHVHLAAHGPFDVVLDASASRAGRQERFRGTFFHLQHGGVYLVRRGGHEVRRHPRGLGRLLTAVLATREEALEPDAVLPLSHQHLLALSAAIKRIWVVDGHLVLRARPNRALAKLDEAETNAYLGLRQALSDDIEGALEGRVVVQLPAEPFESRCRLRINTGDPGAVVPSHYDPVPLALRDYQDVVVAPYQVVSSDRVLLADTYRHNRAAVLTNAHVDELEHRFARVRHDPADVRTLPGTYFHLDNEVRGHFGHLMTEQLSRVWAWPRVRELVPDAKVLLCVNKRVEIQPWEYDVLGAAGIDHDDFVLVDGPVRVERLFSSTPMLCNPEYVHPRITGIWRQVGDTLAAAASPGARPGRIFCSRRLLKRACVNTPEVEEIFARHGFEIVFPEDLSLPDQVELFRRADVVAGFAGSGMFQLGLVTEPKRVVMVTSEAYSAQNEYLFAALLGHEIDSVTCRVAGQRRFQAPFVFDHEREGPWLESILASLGPAGRPDVIG